MKRLAHWRIDPSSIICPEDAREFHEQYATVSEACMHGGLEIVSNLLLRRFAASD